MPIIAPVRQTQRTEPLVPQTPVTRQPLRAPAAPSPRDRTALSATATQSRGPVPRDQILFLGLNPGAAQEVKALRKQASVVVLASENGSYGGHALASADGRAAFVAGLGLDEARSGKLSALLAQAQDHGRDELAALADRWAQAERGAKIPGRLVFSGHSDGLTIWGETGKASLSLGEIGRLADLFPAAAAQIEDLHISGCNTGYRSNAQYWREHFPNLKSFWGYTHTAPAGSNGAPEHLKAWEAASRGASEGIARASMTRQLANVARGGNLAVWSRQQGYQSDLPATAVDLTEIRQIVERYRLGEARSLNPQSGPLKQAYDSLQTLRGEQIAGADDQLIGQALRLRFYDNLARNFQTAYGDLLSAAFTQLGIPAADFGGLERREALQAVAGFKAAFAQAKPELAPEALSQLEKVETLLWHFEQVSPDFFAPEWTDPLSQVAIERARADFETLKPLPKWPLFPGLGLPGLNLPGGLFGQPGDLFGQPGGLFGAPDLNLPDLQLPTLQRRFDHQGLNQPLRLELEPTQPPIF